MCKRVCMHQPVSPSGTNALSRDDALHTMRASGFFGACTSDMVLVSTVLVLHRGFAGQRGDLHWLTQRGSERRPDGRHDAPKARVRELSLQQLVGR